MSAELILGVTTGILTLLTGFFTRLHIRQSDCSKKGLKCRCGENEDNSDDKSDDNDSVEITAI
jgi:hypothetical protein